MTCRHIAFISVVPSPYQRDLFGALARQDGIDLHVFYLENSSPDSPWPQKPLADYEEILPGSWFPVGKARFHYNWPLPDLSTFDIVVLNIPVNAITTQWLTRFRLRRQPWIFWGERLRERLGTGKILHDQILNPFRKAAAIVGVGTKAMEDYQKRFPGPRHFSIPYHCNLEPFLNQPRNSHRENEIVFFCCGQMIARKGIDLLLAAFTRLAPENRDVRLLLVGREAELPQMLATLPCEVCEKIDYEGFQPPEKLPEFFARADVFVLPSRYDGWGVVVNQALGAALPVICSDAVGAGHDLVDEGVSGMRFPSGDANALYEKMKMAASQPETMRQWGVASRKKALDLTPEAGANKWISVFRSIPEQQ